MASKQFSRSTLVLIAALLLCGSGLARAAESAPEKARAQFQRAQSLYQSGDFRGAIGALETAYLDDPQPIFLFNIGRCYRELGENADAARSFRSYLDKAPDDPNRAEIEASILELERPRSAVALPMPRDDSQKSPGLDLTTRPTADRPLYKKAWFWTALGVVVVAAAATTVILLRRDPRCPADYKCGP
jgi:tetratricopeptide (TPR) repeat protein